MGKIYSKLFIDVQDVKILSDLGCVIEEYPPRSWWIGVCECCRDWGHRQGALSTTSTNAHHFLEVLWAHMADTRGSAFSKHQNQTSLLATGVKSIYPAFEDLISAP